MQAIIVTGGKQYKVSEGDVLFIEKLEAEAGQSVVFDQVLAVLDGDKATFGAPTVEGASVDATVVKKMCIRDRGAVDRLFFHGDQVVFCLAGWVVAPGEIDPAAGDQQLPAAAGVLYMAGLSAAVQRNLSHKPIGPGEKRSGGTVGICLLYTSRCV